jgi:hypothetical protein
MYLDGSPNPACLHTYGNGIDMALAQQRIHESLNSFRWIAPPAMALLCFALIAGAIILIQPSLLLAKDQCGFQSTSERLIVPNQRPKAFQAGAAATYKIY